MFTIWTVFREVSLTVMLPLLRQYLAFLQLMLDFTFSSMAYIYNVHCTAFLSVSKTHKQHLTLGFIMMCALPWAAIDSTREWQQAAGLLTSNGNLFVCVFMWSVRPEKPSVAESPPQPEQIRQDRTSHFLQPLWSNSLFSHQSPRNCSVSQWATSWWHSGQQTQ